MGFLKLGLFLTAIGLALVKIWIANQIYLLSVDINSKLKLYYSLESEVIKLQAQIKQIQFKNRTAQWW
jgi:hypothetical protein